MVVGDYLEISLISFFVSFIFGLGGLGSAVALIPILVFLGVPFHLARSAGLFTNVLSTLSATLHNLKKGLVDIKFALPIVVASMLFSPLGAYFSHFVPERLVGLAFALFLFFAGVMIYIPKKGGNRESSSPIFPLFVGSLAGFVSGFLGVGGGALISPLLIVAGFNPKKVAAVTAFAVPFSSFIGFLTYWKMGSVDWKVVLFAGVPAVISGYLAAYLSHSYLSASLVKKLLGIIFFLFGVKLLLKFLI
ncbi:sulfite exporter TauE/SafE family protein [Phorcysia thermohydrogeniphila]|uniref:Probable membrane transporter protein n=1 Tax=Phorcysia thermohydrogeniphila TaxID=936138 RepID=A0A4V2PDT3_9BACT|nr:sulfite exporter TauE/SafE family protein [Phorcysia thermohydrogeniphila]TCK06416.1 hypothetical protein CLV27_0217 [Phorcysia thermohydrogeniphila]